MTDSRRVRGLLIAAALAAAIWGARTCFELLFPLAPRSIKYDLDCDWLLSGIEPTRTFAGTLRWWTGPWCYEYVPYYRPATSLFFWLEYRAFGPMGLAGFTAVHFASHLLMVTLCALFLADLLGRRIALAAMVLYGIHAAAWFGLGDSSRAFPVWKDSCDIWCSIFYVSSAWLFLRFLRTGEIRLRWLSVLAFAAAITFKEMAYTLPLVILLLLWYEKSPRRSIRLALPFFGMAAAAAAYRFWALNGAGFRNGTNGAWLHRTLVDLGGPPARHLLCGDSLPVAVVLLMAALYTGFALRRRRAALGFSAAALLVAILGTAQLGVSPAEFLSRLLLPEVWPEILYVGLFVALALRFVFRGNRRQGFGFGWAAITHLPLMSMPVGDHGFYMVSLGWSIWLAGALPLRQARRTDGVRGPESSTPAANICIDTCRS